jgi:hypothetical protein
MDGGAAVVHTLPGRLFYRSFVRRCGPDRREPDQRATVRFDTNADTNPGGTRRYPTEASPQ